MEAPKKYFPEFKSPGTDVDNSTLRLPGQLFRLRKKLSILQPTGLATRELGHDLDRSATALSQGRTGPAKKMLSVLENAISKLETRTRVEIFHVVEGRGFHRYELDGEEAKSENGFGIRFNENIVAALRRGAWSGEIQFEYQDRGDGRILGRSNVGGVFGEVFAFRLEGKQITRRARIKLF